MRQDQKLVWIRQDLGDEATLEDFARKFLEIFGNKVVSAPQQKKTVLELYSKYAPSGSENHGPKNAIYHRLKEWHSKGSGNQKLQTFAKNAEHP